MRGYEHGVRPYQSWNISGFIIDGGSYNFPSNNSALPSFFLFLCTPPRAPSAAYGAAASIWHHPECLGRLVGSALGAEPVQLRCTDLYERHHMYDK